MFYVIESEHLTQPDQHFFRIQTEPGRTNMSHEPKISGWLGTTNDRHEQAHGEYETEEAARAYIEDQIGEQGYRMNEDAEGEPTGFDRNGEPTGEIVAEYHVGHDPYEAGDYFENDDADSLGITAATTDEELEKMAEGFERDAHSDRYRLVGALAYLTDLRNALRDEQPA